LKKLGKRELDESNLTLPQVKKVLETIGEENLDQFQRRTLDYVNKFSKMNPDAVEGTLERLVKDFGLDETEAVQVMNCMPESVDELRIFLAGGRKIIETSKLDAVVALLNENRIVK